MWIFFSCGMVSMMDAILDVPMSEVVEKIAIDQDTKCVLLGNGGKLQPMYEMMLAQEAGNWAKAQTFATQLRVSESELGEMWWQSMNWERQVSSGKYCPGGNNRTCIVLAMHGARGSAGSRAVPLCKTRDTLDLHGTSATA